MNRMRANKNTHRIIILRPHECIAIVSGIVNGLSIDDNGKSAILLFTEAVVMR